MDLEKLEEKKERNREQRIEFIKFWVDYIKNHDDEVWSRQQNVIIDSQMSKKDRSDV